MNGRLPSGARLVCAILLFGCAGRRDDSTEPAARGPEVTAAARHDISPPLRLMTPAQAVPRSFPRSPLPLPRPLQQAAMAVDAAPRQQSIGPLIPSTLANFDGMGNGLPGFTVQSAPPDPDGDIGPNHYVEIVNTSIAVFNRQGGLLLGPVATNTVWQGFNGACSQDNDGDGLVKYDRMADRWVITQFAVNGGNGPFFQCVAVSTTPDPTGSYARYAFPFTAFNDYPKMAVWPDAYYFTFNMFPNNQFGGARACAFDRAAMLAARPATQQCFDTTPNYGGLLPADLDGSRLPPAGSPNYLVSLGVSNNDLAFWKFHVDWVDPANSTFVGPTAVAVTAYTSLCGGQQSCVPQPGTSTRLDGLDDRLMYRAPYRNFGDHEVLLASHSVQGSGGGGVRWYELRDLAATSPTVFQQGTYAPDANFRWMGSIAMDGNGGIAVGFSISSSTVKPGINYAGRLATDPPGVMGQGEGTIVTGTGVQTGFNFLTRWGDYTSLAVDPTDDCTFWYTGEYMKTNGEFNWNTRVGSFRLPGCGSVVDDFSLSASPSSASVAQGGATTFDVSTAIIAGNAQSVALSVSGLPAGMTASFNPVTVTAGGSSTLTVSAGATAPGSYILTLTGTGPSVTHSVSVGVTVVVVDDFSIGVNPTSAVLVQGGSVTLSVSTTIASGNAQPVALSVSGLPAGVTASFNPATLLGNASSTFTVDAAPSAVPGAYVATITGTGPSATHSAAVAVTVIGVPDDFSIGVNPTSAVLVQGGSTSVSVSTTIASGNAQSVALSISGLPAGVTASFNPATLTGDASSILTVDAAPSAVPGAYVATITGTGPSATHSVSVSIVVVPVLDDFSIGASPSNVAASQGGTAVATISTTVTSGASQPVALTASGLPSGTSASFTPAVVNAGSGAALTLSVGPSTPPGSYTLTITGTGTAATHLTVVTLNVTAGVIINGGFETGDLSGWRAQGTVSVVGSSHSGAFAVRVGSPTGSRPSAVHQRFTVPARGGVLSFWYQIVCLDVVRRDWAVVSLHDHATGARAMILPRTCTNDGQWVQRAFDLGAFAGHDVTLTLSDHDDRSPRDPTYTLFDDVTVQ